MILQNASEQKNSKSLEIRDLDYRVGPAGSSEATTGVPCFLGNAWHMFIGLIL
jgi:hypothetical protein